MHEKGYLCRLCLNSCEFLINIFEQNGKDGLQVWKIIIELLRVDVSEDDGLPQTICNKCMRKLTEFNEFKTMCIGSLSKIRGKSKYRGVKSLNCSINAKLAELDVDNLKVKKSTSMYGRPSKRYIMKYPHSSVEPKDADSTSSELRGYKLPLRGGRKICQPVGDVKTSSPEGRSCRKGSEIVETVMVNNQPCNEYNCSSDVAVIDIDDIEIIEHKVENIDVEPGLSLKSLNRNSAQKQGNPIKVKNLQCIDYSDTLDVITRRKKCTDIVEQNEVPMDNRPTSSLETIMVNNQPCGEFGLNSDVAVIDIDDMEIVEHKVENINVEPDLSLKSVNGPSAQKQRNPIKVKNLQCIDYSDTLDVITRRKKCTDIVEQKEVPMDNRPTSSLETIMVNNQPCGEFGLNSDVAVIDIDDMEIVEHKVENINVEPDLSLKSVNGPSAQKQRNPIKVKNLQCIDYSDTLDVITRRKKCTDIVEQKEVPMDNRPTSSLNTNKVKSLECIDYKDTLDPITRRNNCLKLMDVGPNSLGNMLSLPLEPVEVFVNLPTKCDLDLEPEKIQADPLAVDYKEAQKFSEARPVLSNKGVGKVIKHSSVKGGKKIYKVLLCKVSSEGGKPFECPYCQTRFVSRGMFNRHVKLHFSMDLFECEYCGRLFNMKLLLKQHMKDHGGKKPYHCDFCAEDFETSLSWRVHLENHEYSKNYRCGICLKTYTRKSSLREHFSVHLGSGVFQCAVCKKRFKQKGQLIQHYRSHIEFGEYKCDLCLKLFHRKVSIKRHLRTHREQQRYHCSICGFNFSSGIRYKIHTRLHYQPNLYICDICQASFDRKRGIGRHMVRHRKGAIMYPCDVCGREFSYKSSLRNHSRTHERAKGILTKQEPVARVASE